MQCPLCKKEVKKPLHSITDKKGRNKLACCTCVGLETGKFCTCAQEEQPKVEGIVNPAIPEGYMEVDLEKVKFDYFVAGVSYLANKHGLPGITKLEEIYKAIGAFEASPGAPTKISDGGLPL